MLHTRGNVDPDGHRCLSAMLDDGAFRSAVYMQSTESTNAAALRDCQEGIEPGALPRLYLTDQQTEGRGRHGRRWLSGDTAITLSLVIHCQQPAHLLPIAAGVGVARSIEFTYAPLRARLKWPNDVYIDHGKVAGILIETNQRHPDRIVIGVGVNVGATPELSELISQDALHRPAEPRSIAGAAGRPVARYEMLPSLVSCMVGAIEDLPEAGETILSEFRERCLLTNQQITFTGAGGPQTGACLGITDEGALAVKTESGIHHCRSGEAHQIRLGLSSRRSPG